MSNPFETHGAFSWAELMTTDCEAATQFYQQLFGWTFTSTAMPDGEYHLAMRGDEKIAGIMQLPPEAAGAPPHWGNYVTVADVDAVAESVTKHGGKLLVPPTDIPNVGRFILFQDPQGATLSAMTYAETNEE